MEFNMEKWKKEKKRKCYRQVIGVLQFGLNAKNELEAISTLVIPAVTYSFNAVNWNLEELTRIDWKIRKLMTLNRMHHPKADVRDVNIIYSPRNEEGRWMPNLEMVCKATTIDLKNNLQPSSNRTLVKESMKFKFKLNMTQEDIDINIKPIKAAKDIRKKAKNVV